jgi:hypothetical protein
MKRNLLIITLLFLGSFVILLLGNIIIIGEKIASLSHVAWAEYAFYALILVVFYVVVIRPVVRVHRAPQIPALSIDGEWNTAQLVAFGHKLADNCNYIPKDKSCPELRKLHQQRLREDLERYATSKEELVQIISKELKLRIEGGELKETSGPRIEDMYSVRIIGINRRIIEWAKKILLSVMRRSLLRLLLPCAILFICLAVTGHSVCITVLWAIWTHLWCIMVKH